MRPYLHDIVESPFQQHTVNCSPPEDKWKLVYLTTKHKGFQNVSTVLPFPRAHVTKRLERCTKSVILKVHSLRQLGKERLTFENSYNKGDLSYIEFKVRSVIFGEGRPNKVRYTSFLSGAEGVLFAPRV